MRLYRPSLWLMGALGILGGMNGCQTTRPIGGPISHEALTDGVFEGFYKAGPNAARVQVTIRDRRVVEIVVIAHSAWKGRIAEPVIPSRIIAAQSTDVEAVTGATNSSRVLMNAVEQAIGQSIAQGKRGSP